MRLWELIAGGLVGTGDPMPQRMMEGCQCGATGEHLQKSVEGPHRLQHGGVTPIWHVGRWPAASAY